MNDLSTLALEDFKLQNGEVVPQLLLAYKTYGQLNNSRDNVVLLPTFYTGTHIRNEGFFGSGRAIDPAHHYIVSINLFGNGYSSSPSNTPVPFDGPNFPIITLFDNVKAQYMLLFDHLGISSIALAAGWSMAGCQSFQWAAQYPSQVRAILPFCGSARTSEHNYVFLEGVKAALQADCAFNGGNYQQAPVKGLQAFARVYAGWAYSQTFYRQGWYRKLGFDSAELLLQDWEKDHLEWDANDLLCKLKSWQLADISKNDMYNGDFAKALSSIKAKTIVISCNNDLYFRPEDNDEEVKYIHSASHHKYHSPWGHCVASPGNCPEFEEFLDHKIRILLDA